ncbi:hypothetical protein JB92DRAFT_3128294 [Gautieria morchelliformis]|nr:hypothetical protein JB92DRAFT_3128294 [Gautieria morchelliformis]
MITTPLFTLGTMDLVPVSLKLTLTLPLAYTQGSIALVVEHRLEVNNPPFRSIDASLSSTTNLAGSNSNPLSPSSKTSTSLVTSSKTTQADVARDENASVYICKNGDSTGVSTEPWSARRAARRSSPPIHPPDKVDPRHHGTYEVVELEERELRITL